MVVVSAGGTHTRRDDFFLFVCLVPYLEELVHHLLGVVSKQNVEVQNSSDGPVGHSWSRLQGHLWRNEKNKECTENI